MVVQNSVSPLAGVADITPDTMLPLFGRAGPSRLACIVGSRLEANCLLFFGASEGPAALVTIDSLYPSAALVELVMQMCAAKGLSLAPDGVVIVASHTHNAPPLDQTKPNLGAFDLSYLAFVANRISECLFQLSLKASSDITTLMSGYSVCAASVYRRKTLWGFDWARLQASRRMVMAPDERRPIGQTLKLVLLTNATGQPHCILWSWPCHAVSEPNPLAISADFPGAVRDYMRSTYGIPSLPVLYFPGFSGDIRPASSAYFPFHKSGAWLGFGRRFSTATPRLAEHFYSDITKAFDKARANLKPNCDLAGTTLTRSRRSLALMEIRDDSGDLPPITCDYWHFGPLRITAVSAEVASDYETAVGGNDPLSFPTGCATQVFGYIPTDRQIPEGGYEVEDFAPIFSVPGRFKSSIESKVTSLITY